MIGLRLFHLEQTGSKKSDRVRLTGRSSIPQIEIRFYESWFAFTNRFFVKDVGFHNSCHKRMQKAGFHPK
jgi:hypothetical protein